MYSARTGCTPVLLNGKLKNIRIKAYLSVPSVLIIVIDLGSLASLMNRSVMSVILIVCYLPFSISDQGCYQLTKKSTAGTNNPMSTKNPDYTVVFTTTSANILSNMSTNKHVEM